MDLDHKSIPFQVTDLKAREGGGWEVAGYASTFGGEPDSYGDVVAKGAFVDSIAKRSPKFFYQHAEPIGTTLSIAEDEKGLFGRFAIIDTAIGTDAYKLAKAGAIDSLSIGFRTVDQEFREDGTRILKKVDLFEVSLVAIPANTNAVLTSVKSLEGLPFDAMCRRVAECLDHAAGEAKALHTRRAADGRELTDRHVEAIQVVLAKAEAWLEPLRGLSAPPAEAKADGDLKLRLELARRRLGRLAEGVALP